MRDMIRRILVMLVVVMSSSVSYALEEVRWFDFKYEGFIYHILEDRSRVEIIAYVGDASDVEIPSEVSFDGFPYKVTRICSRAFYGLEKLETVTVPEGVTDIEFAAFYDCPSLWWVDLPDSLEVLGNICYGRHSFDRLIVPDGTRELKEMAICGMYTKAVMGRGVELVDWGLLTYEGFDVLYMLPEKTPELRGNVAVAFYPDNFHDVTVYVTDPDKEEFQHSKGTNADEDKWCFGYFFYKKLPSVFTFFYRDRFVVDEGGTVELRHRMYNVDGVDITDIEWVSDNAGVEVSDGVARGIIPGSESNVTVRVYDSMGNVYCDSIPVKVSGTYEPESVTGIPVEADSVRTVYSMDGHVVGTTTDRLPSGLYIERTSSGTRKILKR